MQQQVQVVVMLLLQLGFTVRVLSSAGVGPAQVGAWVALVCLAQQTHSIKVAAWASISAARQICNQAAPAAAA